MKVEGVGEPKRRGYYSEYVTQTSLNEFYNMTDSEKYRFSSIIYSGEGILFFDSVKVIRKLSEKEMNKLLYYYRR